MAEPFPLQPDDPAAPAALRRYAEAAEWFNHQDATGGMTLEYIASIRELADEFDRHREEHGAVIPEAGRRPDPDAG